MASVQLCTAVPYDTVRVDGSRTLCEAALYKSQHNNTFFRFANDLTPIAVHIQLDYYVYIDLFISAMRLLVAVCNLVVLRHSAGKRISDATVSIRMHTGNDRTQQGAEQHVMTTSDGHSHT
jgi:hypothetical protein